MALSTPSFPRALGVIDCDIRGQMCPSTLLSALRQVNERKLELRSGGLRLRFRTDNREATVTIPDAVQNMGYEVSVTREAGYYAITVSGPSPG
jgi:TusA-related sulfurtransferase